MNKVFDEFLKTIQLIKDEYEVNEDDVRQVSNIIRRMHDETTLKKQEFDRMIIREINAIGD